MKLHVANWRCIRGIECELRRINVFTGRNSTGKSSLAYAVYFLSKLANKQYEPNRLLSFIYGLDLKSLVRTDNRGSHYPVLISVDDYSFVAEEREEIVFSKPSDSPWTDEFLLPSRRIAYFELMSLLPRVMRNLEGQETTTGSLGGFVDNLASFLKAAMLLPPLSVFIEDYVRSITGVSTKPVVGGLKGLGSFALKMSPLIELAEPSYEDPFVRIRLPLEASPDGLLDFSIFESMSRRIPKGSLLVIEEPEIHKSHDVQSDFVEMIVERVLKKDLTVIMTTHSSHILRAVADLVNSGKLNREEVKIYRFERNRRKKWTSIASVDVRGLREQS